eukprot:TRINITY_DN4635_c0_g1_i3.p1 TRINITY_DN4635_c0_g1~~TRINITY_DN4635_c0_g1_i3.p1  ORF type:complete len:297 (-),score=45.19 TRINITY_DN4635_c0_g1_i3:1055-1945(-)
MLNQRDISVSNLQDGKLSEGGVSVSSNLVPLRAPLKSFTFDIPSLPLLQTNIATSAASSVTAPSPSGMQQNYNFPQSSGVSEVSHLSPRSPFGGQLAVGNNNSKHSATPSFASSVPGLEAANVDANNLLDNVSDEELNLLMNLLQQQQALSTANSNAASSVENVLGLYQQPIMRQAPSPYSFMGSPSPLPSDKYKTEVCKLWEKDGVCKFGPGCHFAHGVHELKQSVRHPKYKTQLCRNYSRTGTCQYGQRCQYIHQMIPATVGPIPQIPDINQLPSEEELSRVLQIQQLLSNLEL